MDNMITKIISLSKKINKFYIDKEVVLEFGINDLTSENNTQYNNKIIEAIIEDFQIYRKYKGVYFNIQNEEIIIRNIDDIKTKKHKEIINLIKFEINQYMPIDLQNYIVRYKKIKEIEDKEVIQGILFPRKFVTICNEISKKINIRHKYLNINFDILQKMISTRSINICGSKVSNIIENRKNDLIINKIYNNQIIESYILSKDYANREFINNLSQSESTYYYGISDDYIKYTKKLEVNSKLNLHNDGNLIDNINYLNELGMVT